MGVAGGLGLSMLAILCVVLGSSAPLSALGVAERLRFGLSILAFFFGGLLGVLSPAVGIGCRREVELRAVNAWRCLVLLQVLWATRNKEGRFVWEQERGRGKGSEEGRGGLRREGGGRR